MVNDIQKITRQCRCGGTAIAIDEVEEGGVLGMTARRVTATVQCERCGRKFSANVGRLEEWCANKSSEIDFFIRRKTWARNLLAELGLTEPGQNTTGEFEGQRFQVRIGPRGGVRIWEDHTAVIRTGA